MLCTLLCMFLLFALNFRQLISWHGIVDSCLPGQHHFIVSQGLILAKGNAFCYNVLAVNAEPYVAGNILTVHIMGPKRLYHLLSYCVPNTQLVCLLCPTQWPARGLGQCLQRSLVGCSHAGFGMVSR
jgi:hypothetical protein